MLLSERDEVGIWWACLATGLKRPGDVVGVLLAERRGNEDN